MAPAEDVDLPSTLERSPRKVRRAYAETLDAREAGIEGRSKMTKKEPARALQREYDRQTRRATR